jgi:signal transduction histidine kinase/putative methionine-R-sulfoxide reductase with GAF domain
MTASSADNTTVRRLRNEVHERQRELLILSRVASRVHRQDSVEGVLQIALDEILDGLGLAAGWVFLGDDNDRQLRLAAHRGISTVYLREIETNGLGSCLCPEVFSTAHPLQARNTTECPRMPTIVDGPERSVAHACIPLAFDGTSRGVLNVAARPGGRFSEHELRFLETVGRQVCLAVERARHLHAERLHNQEARALASLNKRIGEMLDTDAVLRGVGQTALEVLASDRVQILLGSDPRELTVAHLAGLPHPELREGQVLDLVVLGASLQRRALVTQESFRLTDWSEDERANREVARRWEAAGALILPLVARRTTLGLLAITKRVPHAWTDDQLDVAEALASQAAVAIESAHLYEKARRAYRDLNEAQARIIQNEKMAVVGTFASGLAHEVRNPLNSIALQLSILERRVAPLETGLSGELKELLGIIREEVKRLDNLVGDFLQFSRTNRIQYRPASIDALLDEVMRLLRPEARSAGVVLRRTSVGGAIPDLRVDAEKIKQVVINLVQNAIEAMPAGGTAEVESGLLDGHATIAVRDTGPGLPEGLDVFQLFVTTKAKGTGLGLPIAQQIVLEHGGVITAESAPGGGAVFTVRLPGTPAEDKPELERP